MKQDQSIPSSSYKVWSKASVDFTICLPHVYRGLDWGLGKIPKKYFAVIFWHFHFLHFGSLNLALGPTAFQTVVLIFRFSSAKKCSNEGRALMQLDFRQFVLKLEAISDLKPLPHQDLVIISKTIPVLGSIL